MLYKQMRCFLEVANVLSFTAAAKNLYMSQQAVSQRNRFFPGDELELLMPGQAPVSFTAGALYDETGSSLPAANHPKMTVQTTLPLQAPPDSFLRKRRTENIPGHAMEPEGGI